MTSERENSRVGVAKLFWAKLTHIGNTVDVVTKRAEVWIRNEVEREKASEKKSKEERDANDEQNALPEGVPFAKGDVRDEDYGSRKTKQ